MMNPEFVALQRAVAGRYSLEREIGRGGMGIVFLARDVALDRPVAIKMLPPELARDASRRGRFLGEARMAARLSHPHIVPIHAVEERSDVVFFVMTYVAGETLGARLRRSGPLPAEEGLRILQEVAWALGHAHAHGVVHRDVKPDNILLEQGSGRALVADFGIGQVTSDLERTSGAVGTPHFMSPEQGAGGAVDGRSDICALGVTAYVTLAGRLPFEGSAIAVRGRHASDTATRLHELRPSLPARAAEVVERCLAKEPDERYQTGEAVAEALRSARGAGAELAPQLRAFMREGEQILGEMGTSFTAATVAMLLALFFLGDFVTPVLYAITAALMLGIGGVRYVQLLGRTRELVRDGWQHEAIIPALEQEERRRSEEEQEPGSPRHAVELAALTFVGAAKTAAGLWLVATDAWIPTWLIMLGFAVTVIVPTAMIRQLWSALGRDSHLWARLLRGGVGRFTFGVAGLRAGEVQPRVLAAGEPTVMIMARAAEDLFDALPSDQRRELRELPSAIHRLRREVDQLRERGQAERASTAIAALETIRLGLLHLNAGGGDPGELTRELEAADRLMRDMDALAEGRDAVRDLLERTPT